MAMRPSGIAVISSQLLVRQSKSILTEAIVRTAEWLAGAGNEKS